MTKVLLIPDREAVFGPLSPLLSQYPIQTSWMDPMLSAAILALALAAPAPTVPSASQPTALVTHTYEARIRLNGKVSTTHVQASDAGQAKKIVQAQFPTATVLSVKKVD